MYKRLIILPTYNEAENIGVLVPQILTLLPDCAILVIDDGSADETFKVATTLARSCPNLTVINRGEKLGLGSAYKLGFKWGISNGFQELIQMDADLSHRVRDLIGMIEFKSRLGADVIIGSRWIDGGATTNWARWRVFLSRSANLFARTVLGQSIQDWTSGFRIYSAELIRKINVDSITSEGYAFQIEMTRAARSLGALIKEYPIVFQERHHGNSKMSLAIALESVYRIFSWGIRRFFNLLNWKSFLIRLFVRTFPNCYRSITKYPLLLREYLISRRKVNFSQFGEDEILTELCPRQGFYLDIGSGRPVSGSNTYALYKQGWSGVLVDPLSINKFLSRHLRKRDLFVHALLGDGSNVSFHEFFPYQFSTSSKEVASKLIDTGVATLVDEVELHTTSVDSLVGFVPSNLTLFLNIDCEGYDIEVLKTFPFDKYQPQVICIEDWLFSDEHASPIHELMNSLKYELFTRKGLSSIYRHT